MLGRIIDECGWSDKTVYPLLTKAGVWNQLKINGFHFQQNSITHTFLRYVSCGITKLSGCN